MKTIEYSLKSNLKRTKYRVFTSVALFLKEAHNFNWKALNNQ